MKKLLLTVAAAAAFSQAQAETNHVDMTAPKAGVSEVKAGVDFVSGKTEYNNSTEAKLSGFNINAEYAYGFHDLASVYIAQDMYSASGSGTANPNDINGLGSTEVGVKGLYSLGNPSLFYSAGYNAYLFSERKVETDKQNMFDMTDTRNHVALSGGVLLPYDAFTFAAQLKYQLFQDTTVKGVAADSKYKSGSGFGWKLSAQYNLNIMKLGLAYGQDKIDGFDVTTNTTTNKVDADTAKTIELYAIIPVANNVDAIVDIKNIKYDDTAGVKSNDLYLAKVGMNMNF